MFLSCSVSKLYDLAIRFAIDLLSALDKLPRTSSRAHLPVLKDFERSIKSIWVVRVNPLLKERKYCKYKLVNNS